MLGVDQRPDKAWKIHGVHHGVQERSFDSYYQEIKKRPSSERKAKVQELHEDGVSNRAIGAKLGIDEKTVRGDLKGHLPPLPDADIDDGASTAMSWVFADGKQERSFDSYLLLGDQLTPRSTKRMRQGESERLDWAIAKGAR